MNASVANKSGQIAASGIQMHVDGMSGALFEIKRTNRRAW